MPVVQQMPNKETLIMITTATVTVVVVMLFFCLALMKGLKCVCVCARVNRKYYKTQKCGFPHG